MTETTAAVYRHGADKLSIETVVLDDVAPDEVLVRVRATGVCHSDVQIASGASRAPRGRGIVLGHEGAGDVVAAGAAVRAAAPGDRVVVVPPGFCGACRDCLAGAPAVCRVPVAARQRAADGGGAPLWTFLEAGSFAGYMLVHESLVTRVPHDLPYELAALLGCGAITGLGAVLRTAAVRPGDDVAVLGCGGVGLAAVLGAVLVGAGRVVAVDVSSEKVGRALALGATWGIVAGEDAASLVRTYADGRGVDHAIEATGAPAMMRAAVEVLAPRGTATLVGVPPPGADVSFPWLGFRLEQRVQTSRMGSNVHRTDVPAYAELWRRGRLNLGALVGFRGAFPADVNGALDRVRAGAVVGRAVLEVH